MDQFKELLDKANAIDLTNITVEQQEQLNLVKDALTKLSENKLLSTVGDLIDKLSSKASSCAPIVFFHNSTEYTLSSNDITLVDGKVVISIL